MATLSIRLPDSLHRQLKSLAKKEKISINQLITTVVAEKMSALMTEDYLETLARQGDREDFDRVLAKVPSVPPDPIDVLYGCLKDLPGEPLADLEAEHRLELLTETDRYVADLVAEVGPPSAAQRTRAAALARLARRPRYRQAGNRPLL